MVEITIISCHAAGWCALGASNAGVGTAVLRGGRVGGNWLSFCTRARTTLRNRIKKKESNKKHGDKKGER